MGYHTGSVWPHDNALIAFGMARYGMAREVTRVFAGLFDAAIYFELHRIPWKTECALRTCVIAEASIHSSMHWMPTATCFKRGSTWPRSAWRNF